MRRASPLLLTFALAAAAPSRAQTAIPEHPFRDLTHARSMAMGGAYRALGLGVETVVGNPAAMSQYQHYNLELSGAWDLTQNVAWAALGVMDSTNRLSAGVAYHLVSFGEPADRTLAHLNTLAVSIPFLDNVFVGAAAHYLVSAGALQANAVTADVGILVRVFNLVSIGLAGHNLVDTRHAALSTYFTASAAFSNGLLSLVADVRGQYREADSPLLAFNAGGEFVFAEGIPIRAGWSLDERGQSFLSGGLGWMFQGGAVDAAYRHELNGIGRAVALTIKVGN